MYEVVYRHLSLCVHFPLSQNGGLQVENAGVNWPLRGAKYTLFEGGTRAVGFIWGPSSARHRLREQPVRSFEHIHIRITE